MSASELDYVIVGAGPAGLQLGYFLEKAGRNYIILDKAPNAGATFQHYPRHRNLISINKVYTGEVGYDKNLRWDWNSLLTDEKDLDKQPLFTKYTDKYFPAADTLVQYLQDFARAFSLKIRYNAEVSLINKDAKSFSVQTVDGQLFRAPAVVVATGFMHNFTPDIPGIELAKDYRTMDTNPAAYNDHEVLIIGKGNSGFETAECLIPTTALIHICSPSNLNFAWKTHYIGHLRAVNNNLLDTYQLKSQNAVLDASILEMKPSVKRAGAVDVTLSYSHALGETEILTYDSVFNCTGFTMDTSMYGASASPTLTHMNKFPSLRSNWESTNVEGLFFAGVLSHSIDYKKHTSGFIHGFRYCVRTLFHLLEQRYSAVPYPRREIPGTVEGVLAAIIDRAATTSALWQQFGYLVDVITVQDERAHYYEELTGGIVRDSDLANFSHYYTFSLEFNKVPHDPFEIHRKPNPTDAQESVFLHPVVRQYNKLKLMNEIHILEDLYTDWTHPTQHVQPLRRFLTACFEGRVGFKIAKPIRSNM
jgi:thioredoxin reductase